MENKTLIPPKNGWKAHTWYKGKCSMRTGNPKFDVLIFSGFLDDNNNPQNYSGVFAANYVPSDGVWSIQSPKYLKVDEELWTVK